MRRCTLCDEICGESTVFGPEYCALVESQETCLASTENLVLMPSVGALNSSHVMIVPRVHYRNFASTPPSFDLELEGLKARIKEFAKQEYGWDMIFFEHGAGTGSDTSGSCIDHAHIHAIRSIPRFQDALHRSLDTLIESDASEIRQIADLSSGYLCFESSSSRLYIANNPSVPPQYFRASYARAQGGPLMWNWRFDIRIGEVKNVVRSFVRLKEA